MASPQLVSDVGSRGEKPGSGSKGTALAIVSVADPRLEGASTTLADAGPDVHDNRGRARASAQKMRSKAGPSRLGEGLRPRTPGENFWRGGRRHGGRRVDKGHSFRAARFRAETRVNMGTDITSRGQAHHQGAARLRRDADQARGKLHRRPRRRLAGPRRAGARVRGDVSTSTSPTRTPRRSARSRTPSSTSSSTRRPSSAARFSKRWALSFSLCGSGRFAHSDHELAVLGGHADRRHRGSREGALEQLAAQLRQEELVSTASIMRPPLSTSVQRLVMSSTTCSSYAKGTSYCCLTRATIRSSCRRTMRPSIESLSG